LLHTHVVYRCKVAIEDSHLDIQLDSRATHSLTYMAFTTELEKTLSTQTLCKYTLCELSVLLSKLS
jgi:hypothetical protein